MIPKSGYRFSDQIMLLADCMMSVVQGVPSIRES
jgi:hypothetical protein